ncbi:MAG: hypothetical protein QNK27_12075 [Desulfuromusa sp.]|nr:hypothetical protein [Desulfuromusa sp.]
MINSVGTNSSMSMMASRAMQRQPPPADKNAFEVEDSGSGGSVSSAELKTSATGVQGATGTSSDIEEVFDLLDVNEDGIVSNEELQGLMASQGFNPTGMVNSEDGESSMRPPPPPPPPSEVVSAYESNSGEDTISQLIELLTGSSDSEEYSSLSMTA